MRMTTRLSTILGSFGLAALAVLGPFSSPAAAQPPAIGVRGFFAADFDAMRASNSFKTVLDTSTLKAFGGGVDVLNVWKQLFVHVALTHASKDGERAVVFNGQAIKVGIPITVSMMPVEVGAGWRFASPRAKVAPYAGGGALMMKYSDGSPFATSGDDVDLSKTGYFVLGGVDYSVMRHVVVGGEVQFRSVPGAIGTAGVSKDYNEKDLGAVAARLLVGVRF